ncbi:hypothetical protein [Leucobacter massiliensis]|uniref:hypothetical protein n=1 Tax=Leucobacter massiliensis TaxID=1686285 RepID=UPI000CFF6428|nr:hypothetical protein [Leucobacter massiliensis]
MSTLDHARPDRAARAWRGAAGAGIATVLAASSHGLAGGSISWFAVIATVILALPLCTVLAGRIGSLWRLGIAVAGSQFMYHGLFSWIGGPAGATAPASATPAEALSPHAAHLGLASGADALGSAALGTPALAAAPAVDASACAAMWFGHAVAAMLTIALLHRGERAFLALIRLIRRALPAPRILAPQPARRSLPALTSWAPVVSARTRLLAAVISHRGPPAIAA